jgi:hypothetical protein
MAKTNKSRASIDEKMNDRKRPDNHAFRNVMLSTLIAAGTGIFGPLYLIDDEMPLKPANASFDESLYEDYLFRLDMWTFKHSTPFYVMAASGMYAAVNLFEQNKSNQKYNRKRKQPMYRQDKI